MVTVTCHTFGVESKTTFNLMEDAQQWIATLLVNEVCFEVTYS